MKIIPSSTSKGQGLDFKKFLVGEKTSSTLIITIEGVILFFAYTVIESLAYTYNLFYGSLMTMITSIFAWCYPPIKYSIFISLVGSIIYLIIKVFHHKDSTLAVIQNGNLHEN